VGRRIAKESGRALVPILIAVVVVFLLLGAGTAGACKVTSLNCRLHRGPGPAPDLQQTSGDIGLPEGFSAHVIAADLATPTDFDFLPDGRMLVAERSGLIKLLDSGGSLVGTALDLRPRMSIYGFRGLMAIAVDPDFAQNRYVYVSYTPRPKGAPATSAAPTRVEVSRFTMRGDRAEDERVLVGAHPNAAGSCVGLPASADCLPSVVDHIGTGITFAADGTLFVSTGDGGGEEHVEEVAFGAQDMDALNGKLLHVSRDGLGLSSNPFYDGHPEHNRSKVWAIGFRNPFRATTVPGSGIPVVGDVGDHSVDEIDVVSAGKNYGWPCFEGDGRTKGYRSTDECKALYASGRTFVGPVFQEPHAGKPTSITGGVFVSGDQYPAEYRAYVFGDWARSSIQYLPPDPTSGEPHGDAVSFAQNAGGPVAFRVGPDGHLYYLALNYGKLYRIDFDG
jgi:glucose/arabinose dehydrogenase